MSEHGHLDMEALLALRDGEGAAYARSHIESCAWCRGELDRLHHVRAELRALPRYRAPRDLWPRVASGARRRRVRRHAALGVIGLAAAAMLAGVLVLRGSRESAESPEANVWSMEIDSPDLGPAIVRSRQLETLLNAYQLSSRVYDAPTALAVSVLEDRISLLDRMLAESRAVGANRETLRELWGERVVTLEKLVGLELATEEGVLRRRDEGGRSEGVWR